jgi:hypothetical protein
LEDLSIPAVKEFLFLRKSGYNEIKLHNEHKEMGEE